MNFRLVEIIVIGAVCLLLGNITIAAPKEADYQNEWCKGQAEVILSDRTRVDCLTDTHAIEIDFASKWKQSIGQSLHYALMTGKEPGIALILRKESDQRYVDQLNEVIGANELPIKVWEVTKGRLL